MPFFVGGRNAFVEGIGERLTPLALPPQRFAVVKPAAAIATADIFGSPALVRDTEPVILTGFLASAGQLAELCTGSAATTCSRPPRRSVREVRAVADWLQGRFGNSRMTGSGSAVFARVGIGRPVPGGMAGADRCPAPGLARMCRSLDHHPLLGWAD